MTSVRFVTPTAGYAYRQDVVDVTADGGTTWRTATLGPTSRPTGQLSGQLSGQLLALEIGAGEAFLAVHVAAGDPSVALYRAPAGSSSFAAVTGGGLAHSATARLLFDGRFGYLSGDLPGAGMAVTDDGGVSWSHKELPCPTGLDARVRVAPFGGGDLYVVCSAPGAGGQYAKSLFVSADAAATFSAGSGSMPPPPDGRLDDLAAPASGYNVVMATSWADSSLFELQGGNWTTVAMPAPGGLAWHDLRFTSVTQGVAILGDQTGPGPGDGAAGLYMTHDGGRTWPQVDFRVRVLPSPCVAGQLALSQPANVGDEALGNVLAQLVLTNRGETACSLDGFPGLTLLDQSGRALPNPITRSTNSYFFSDRDVEPVVLGGRGARPPSSSPTATIR